MQRFQQCQVYGDFIWIPPNNLNVIDSLWSFTAWGKDGIRLIETSTSNGHCFILEAIDFFTKWVKASMNKAITTKVVGDFVCNNMVC